MSIGYLVPLDVPWKVSPSTTGINVCTWEGYDTEVGVNVFLWEGVDPRSEVFCPDDPRVVITFNSGQWVSFSPGASDESSIDLSAYDLSKYPFVHVTTDAEWDAIISHWIRSQRCPRPGVFEVESSELVARAGLTRSGFRHFIVGGHDVRVEVLARDFSWRYVPRKDWTVEAV